MATSMQAPRNDHHARAALIVHNLHELNILLHGEHCVDVLQEAADEWAAQ